MKKLTENKFINKYPIISIILSAFALATIVWGFGRLISSDLGKFPFEADVWGTASDYFSILVTGVSLFFIFRSLEYQRESVINERRRNKHDEIEKRKLLKCDFDVSFKRNNDGEHIDIYIINNGDRLNNATVDIFTEVGVIFNRKDNIYNTEGHYRMPLVFHNLHEYGINIETVYPLTSALTISIRFFDVYGYEYLQNIIIFSSLKVEKYSLKHI